MLPEKVRKSERQRARKGKSQISLLIRCSHSYFYFVFYKTSFERLPHSNRIPDNKY
jgi:hypothetical protein